MADSDWADWLIDALEERGWNKAELAKRSGVDDALISKWLSGKVRPGLANIRTVCAALGVPPVQGMIAAGHLEPDDVGATVVNRPRTTRARDLANDDLLAELARRLNVATPSGGDGGRYPSDRESAYRRVLMDALEVVAADPDAVEDRGEGERIYHRVIAALDAAVESGQGRSRGKAPPESVNAVRRHNQQLRRAAAAQERLRGLVEGEQVAARRRPRPRA